MKTQPVPTAPSERPRRTRSTTNQSHARTTFSRIINWLALAVLALAAGWVGGLIERNFISQADIPDLIFTSNRANQTKTTAEWAEHLLAQQRDTIVTVARNGTVLSRGVIVSTDGWIATPVSVIESTDSLTVQLTDGSVLSSTQVIIDDYSGLAFVKVAGHQLPVVDFASAEPSLGQAVVSFTYSPASGERMTFGHIENVHFNDDDIWSTATQNVVYLFDQLSRPEYFGAPIFSDSGELIGLDILDHRVIPVRAVSRPLYTIFDRSAVLEPRWQFTYTPPRANQPGAVVVSVGQSDLPLEPGDIIMQVGTTSIDRDHDVSEVLMAATTPVECIIRRDGEAHTVTLN